MNEPLTSTGSAGAARHLWHLPRGRAVALPVAGVGRWLRLVEGRLWLTEQGRHGAAPPEDRWLQAGEVLRVPPGSQMLAEGWPAASFELLEEPQT